MLGYFAFAQTIEDYTGELQHERCQKSVRTYCAIDKAQKSPQIQHNGANYF
jgi:hypothetical protein